jgi:hypothetical protein
LLFLALILSLPFPAFAARTFDERVSKTRIPTSNEDILMLGDVLYDLEGVRWCDENAKQDAV